MMTDKDIEEEFTCVYVQAYRSHNNEKDVSKEKLVTAIRYLNTLSGGKKAVNWSTFFKPIHITIHAWVLDRYKGIYLFHSNDTGCGVMCQGCIILVHFSNIALTILVLTNLGKRKQNLNIVI